MLDTKDPSVVERDHVPIAAELAPGAYQLTAELVYASKSLFAHIRDYRFHVRTRSSIHVSEARGATVVGHLKGSIFTSIERRFAVRIEPCSLVPPNPHVD